MFKFTLIIFLQLPSLIFAHEGHHDVPGQVAAPKGGIIRTLETIYLELVTQGELVKVFVYDKKLKPADTKRYPVSAIATRPGKKADEVKVDSKKNHWELSYDAKGSHRYTLQFNIEQGGHKDKIKWNIEPKHKH